MRVGIFTDTYPPYVSGVCTSIMMLKRALEKKGHEVFVVTINMESMSYKFEENGKVVKVPGLPIGLYNIRQSGIYPIRIVNQIKKWHLDVIHSHSEFSIGTFARIIAKQFNIPLIHTYHTMYEDYIHYITKGYFNGISKKIVEYLTLFYCDKTISELVVPTKKTYDLFKEKYKIDRNIYIVPTGIEVEKFYRENFEKKQLFDLKHKLGISHDDFVLLYVGRIAIEKNIEFLMEVHRSLSKKFNNIKFLVIGDGPDLDNMKNIASHSDFHNSVIFAGKIPFTEIPLYYQLGDLFLTASKTETQGLTVIEAMSASIPVICIEDESFVDIVVSGLNGYTFRTKRQCRTVIADLYNDKEKLNNLKKQARITGSLHSSKYYAERILDVYNIAINNYKNRKPSLFDRIKGVVMK